MRVKRVLAVSTVAVLVIAGAVAVGWAAARREVATKPHSNPRTLRRQPATRAMKHEDSAMKGDHGAAMQGRHGDSMKHEGDQAMKRRRLFERRPDEATEPVAVISS